MLRLMLRGKIHRATVTGAERDYEGSITIDSDLLARARILPYERVDVWNVTNGERFTTYALAGPPGSGTVCVNGAAAHKAHTGDQVIIACFGNMTSAEARRWKPRIVFVDHANRPVAVRLEATPDTEGRASGAPAPVPRDEPVTRASIRPDSPRRRARPSSRSGSRTRAGGEVSSAPIG